MSLCPLSRQNNYCVLPKRKCPHERGTHNIGSEAITGVPGDDVGEGGEDCPEGSCTNKLGSYCHVEEGRTLLAVKTPRLKQFINLNNYSVLSLRKLHAICQRFA